MMGADRMVVGCGARAGVSGAKTKQLPISGVSTLSPHVGDMPAQFSPWAIVGGPHMVKTDQAPLWDLGSLLSKSRRLRQIHVWFTSTI